MTYIITYDISDSKIRLELSKFLIGERFKRVQKSIFIGEIDFSTIKRIKRIIKQFNIDSKDSIIIFPFCNEDKVKSIFIGNFFDIEEITEETSIFF